ncbi:MAG: acyl-CoA dehydrogenase [Alphaproteobacteria bacterium]|nr:acyl-CoA dehydrogenase [Alphaproteobacteria bacterium]
MATRARAGSVEAKSRTGTHAEMLARAQELLPTLKARAPECERLRKIPRETIDDLMEAGIINLMLPKRWGGSELDYVALYDVISAVASACASTSWVLTNLISCNFMPCYWPEEAQKELWSETPDTLLLGSLIFTGGRAVPTKGGYKLSGRWPLVSGCDHGDWLVLAAFVEGEEGDARFRMFLVPKADYSILDTWHASGLKGTGSNDVVMTDKFVPEHRTILVAQTKGGDSPGARGNTGFVYRMPLFALFSSWVGASVLGVAQGALQDFLTDTRARITKITGVKMADYSTVQVKVGEAACAINAARALVYDNVREAQEIAKAGGIPTMEQKLRYRADGSYAGEICMRAVDLLHRASGAGGLYEQNVMARHFRDAHAGTSHITQNLDMNVSLFARQLLGLPTDAPML